MAKTPYSLLGERVNIMRQRPRIEKEKRGYIWQCRVLENKERYIANKDTKKQPCGMWHSYFGKKWASEKRDARWQGICPCDHQGKGPRKSQLNLGVVLPESPNYYATRKEAEQAAMLANISKESKLVDRRRFL